MNTENHPKAFFASLAENADLQAKVAEIMCQSARNTAEALAGLSQQTQTPFTAEEFLSSAQQESDGASGEEISDESLAGIHGGFLGLEEIFSIKNFVKTFGPVLPGVKPRQ